MYLKISQPIRTVAQYQLRTKVKWLRRYQTRAGKFTLSFMKLRNR